MYLSTGGIVYAGDLLKFQIAPYVFGILGGIAFWIHDEKK
jgi:hypothetical protein